MLNKPRGILFDFGGTLLEVDFSVERAISRMMELVRQPHNVTLERMKAVGDDLREMMDKIRHTASAEVPLQAFHRHLLDRLGLISDLSPEALEYETSEASHIVWKRPGVDEALNLLFQAEIKLGVVSNTSLTGKSIGWMLEKQGIREPFDFIMTSTDYGLRKPHSDLFTTAAAKLGFSAGDIWFVGDSLEADVVGAQKAGMGAVWFNPTTQTATVIKPDAEFRSWAEFIQLIQTISYVYP